ncbi:MAG TPA: hypothetical protein PLB25_10295 [Rhodoferax sp.]|nr:hypothetical protein [Rhodoferax sp.]
MRWSGRATSNSTCGLSMTPLYTENADLTNSPADPRRQDKPLCVNGRIGFGNQQKKQARRQPAQPTQGQIGLSRAV